MPQFHDKPVRPAVRLTPSAKERLSNAEIQRALHANRRFLVAKTAAEAGPRPCDMVAAVRRIQERLGDWVPTRPTICHLAHLYLHGLDEDQRQQPSFYLIAGHGGRKKTRLSRELQETLEADLREAGHLEADELIGRLKGAAEYHGVPLPSEYVLRRIIEETRGGPLGHSAAANGRRAAEVDGVPHDTLPYTRPFDCLTVDEMVWPTWVGVYHDALGRWTSWLIYVVLGSDYASRAITTFHVCDPTRRPLPNPRARVTAFDTDDVWCAFLKAARPELALDAMGPFTGFIPRHIRMDGHSTHVAWKEAVRALIPTQIHLLANYRPYRNGVQERVNRTIKSLFRSMYATLPGNWESYIPTDIITQNQHDARTQAASTTERVVRRLKIDPADLPRVEDLRDIIVPRVIAEYNERHAHSTHGGRTPRNVFMSSLPRRVDLWSSDPLVRALPTRTVTVSGASLRVEHNGAVRRFDYRVNGRIVPVGQSVVAHVHPLLECIWVVDGEDRRLVHVPLLRTASGQQTPRYVHQSRAAVTGDLSAMAQSNRVAAFRDAAGDDAVARAAAAPDQQPDGEPRATRSPAPGGGDQAPDLTGMVAAGAATPLSAVETWLGPAPVTPPEAVPATDGASAASIQSISVGQAPAHPPRPIPTPSAAPPAAPPATAIGARRAPEPPPPTASFWLTGVTTLRADEPAPRPAPPAAPIPEPTDTSNTDTSNADAA